LSYILTSAAFGSFSEMMVAEALRRALVSKVCSCMGRLSSNRGREREKEGGKERTREREGD